MARGSLTAPLASALLKQETIVRARNVVRIRLHSPGFEKLIRNCCLGWPQLQMFQKQIENITNRHRAFAMKIDKHPMVKNVRQSGTILAMDIQSEKGGYSSDIKQLLYQHFIADGVLLRPLGNVVYILPPYCITNDELDKVYNSIFEALEKVE